jgi:hypothetical protein
MKSLLSGDFAPTAGTAAAPARFAAFFLLAGERLRHDGFLRQRFFCVRWRTPPDSEMMIS